MTEMEKTVVEIDLNGKYILQIPYNTSGEHASRLRAMVDEWLKSDDDPVLIVLDSIKLVKVDE